MARRGLGPDELRLASPPFLNAVRWTLFAEKVYAQVQTEQQVLDMTEASKRTSEVIGARKAARETIAELRVAMDLDDPKPSTEAPTDG